MANNYRDIAEIGAAQMYLSYASKNNLPIDFGKDSNHVPTNVDLRGYLFSDLVYKIKSVQSLKNDLQSLMSDFIEIVPQVGKYMEKFVIGDLPVMPLGLDKSRLSQFSVMYAPIISRIFNNGGSRKIMLTLDVKAVQEKFQNPDQLVDYLEVQLEAMGNAFERYEHEVWGVTFVQNYREEGMYTTTVTGINDLLGEMISTMYAFQAPSKKYNLAHTVDVPLTNQSKMEDLLFIATKKTAGTLIGNILPQLFDKLGIDVAKRVKVIPDMPVVHTMLNDYTLTGDDIKNLQNVDPTLEVGDVIHRGRILLSDMYDALQKPELFENYSLDNENFIMLWDVRNILYPIEDGSGLAPELIMPGFLEVNLFFHFTTSHVLMPFYNRAMICVGPPPTITPVIPYKLDESSGIAMTAKNMINNLLGIKDELTDEEIKELKTLVSEEISEEI